MTKGGQPTRDELMDAGNDGNQSTARCADMCVVVIRSQRGTGLPTLQNSTNTSGSVRHLDDQASIDESEPLAGQVMSECAVLEKDATLEILLVGPPGEIGARDQRALAVDHYTLGVHVEPRTR